MAGVIVLGAAALVSPLLVRTGSLANLKKQAVNRIEAFLLANRSDPFVTLDLEKSALPSPADAWWNP